MRTDLRRWLGRVGVPGGVAEDIVLAAWELCANAIEHPAQPDPSEVTLDAEAYTHGVRVTVHDAGVWNGHRLTRAKRGLGLRIVEGLVDRLAVRRGFEGTEVMLFRCTRLT